MRWADLDVLGHVNNVTYLNYLREARIDFFAGLGRTVDVDDLAESLRVTRNQVLFAAPLLLRPEPIAVEMWVSDIDDESFALNYEVFDDTAQGRVVYLRARAEVHPWVVATDEARPLRAGEQRLLGQFVEESLEFSPMDHASAVATLPARYDLAVRLSDLDIYRRVSDVIYFEYFQEARVAYLLELASRGADAQQLVIARTDIVYHHPVTLRREPYLVRSGVARVGTSSFAVTAEIVDDGTVLATADVVLVGFDAQQQVAAPMTADQRAVLLAEYELTRPR